MLRRATTASATSKPTTASSSSIDYDMQGEPFTVIGAESNVASGSDSAIEWSDLAPGTEYQW
jgi:hypothetical protein